MIFVLLHGCRGCGTFDPFRLIGGIAKGYPDEADCESAAEFFGSL